MFEVRLDSCDLSAQEIGEVFEVDTPSVATCRIAGVLEREASLREVESEDSRLVRAAGIAQKRLEAAVKAGAKFVDVEIEAPKYMSKTVRACAHDYGSVFMRSVHLWGELPSLDVLKERFDHCVYHGADMVKLVVMAPSLDGPQDASHQAANLKEVERQIADLMSGIYAYAAEQGHDLIAFAMGEAGKQSRYDCILRGAPYTYAALSAEEAAAPGQMSAEEMARKIYGDFAFVDAQGLEMPCSKSFAQRAILAAALASGESVLRGYSACGDSEAAIAVAKKLGATVRRERQPVTSGSQPETSGSQPETSESQPVVSGSQPETSEGNAKETLYIKGISASPSSLDIEELHVGESGLLTRLMIPLAAQLGRGKVKIDGEGTLLERTMKGAGLIMGEFGVTIPDDCHVPVEVQGPLKAGTVQISGKYGSQLVSGLLMAAPLSEKNTTITVAEPKSIPYMYITLDVMKKFGIRVANDMLGGRDFVESGGDWGLCSEMVFRVKGRGAYRCADISLESDWSAAANLLVAGAIFGNVTLRNMDTSSLQADLSIIDVLTEAGASMSEIESDVPELIVKRSPLDAFEFDAEHCPDLFPILAVLAAFCRGISTISGLDRLKHKESDRGAAILEMLVQMGVEARVEENSLVVKGETLAQRILSGHFIKGGLYHTHHDHRMAMAIAVASLGATEPVTMDDSSCVDKSFPEFFSIFDNLK